MLMIDALNSKIHITMVIDWTEKQQNWIHINWKATKLNSYHFKFILKSHDAWW